MNNENKLYTQHNYSISKNRELSDWKCELFGVPNGITYTPFKGQEPNWFWRKMQFLCFGHKWVKVK